MGGDVTFYVLITFNNYLQLLLVYTLMLIEKSACLIFFYFTRGLHPFFSGVEMRHLFLVGTLFLFYSKITETLLSSLVTC